MDALETLVRDTLVDRAADAPADHTLLDAVLHKPRRRRWPVIGLAAAAVVAAVVTTVVIAMPQHSTPAGSGSDASTVVAAPSGYRWLTFSGVAIAVPIYLPVQLSECSVPAEYVLLQSPESPQVSCVPPRVPESQQTFTVQLDADQPGGRAADLATAAVSLHGLAVRIGYGTLRPFPGAGGALALPQQHITITVTAPRRSSVEAILNSVHPASDLLGCATQLRPDRGPKRVPLDPLDADACVYSTLGNPTRSLIGVRHLTGSKLRQILRIDRDLIAQTLLVNPQQRYVVLELHYSAGRNVTLGFLSGQAARAVISG